MKRVVLIIAAVIFLSATGADAEENKVCLSDICVGATISDIPQDLKWRQAAPFNPNKSHFLPSGWNKALSENVKTDPATIKDLERYRDHTGGLGMLNGKVIEALTKIRVSVFRG